MRDQATSARPTGTDQGHRLAFQVRPANAPARRGHAPYRTNESTRASEMGANVPASRRGPPVRQDCTAQNSARGRPICGLTLTKNRPNQGGSTAPNRTSASRFPVESECNTTGESRKMISDRRPAPKRRAARAKRMKHNDNRMSRPIISGNSANGIKGKSAQGGPKNHLQSYGDWPDKSNSAAGRQVLCQSMA